MRADPSPPVGRFGPCAGGKSLAKKPYDRLGGGNSWYETKGAVDYGEGEPPPGYRERVTGRTYYDWLRAAADGFASVDPDNFDPADFECPRWRERVTRAIDVESNAPVWISSWPQDFPWEDLCENGRPIDAQIPVDRAARIFDSRGQEPPDILVADMRGAGS